MPIPAHIGLLGSKMPAGGGWTPADLPGLTGWWDASDTASITDTSGAVSQIDDLSGNGYHLVQATAGKQPTTGTTTINGLNLLAFDGGDGLSVASFDLTASGQELTTFAVFTCVAGGDRVIMEHSANFNLTTGAFLVLRTSANLAQLAKRGGSSADYSIFRASGTVTTTPSLFVGTHDGALSTDETSGWLNGSSAGTRRLNDNTSSNNVSADLYVGSRANTSLYLSGNMAEWGVCAAALGTTDRESLQTYLSAKWGITL